MVSFQLLLLIANLVQYVAQNSISLHLGNTSCQRTDILFMKDGLINHKHVWQHKLCFLHTDGNCS